MAARAVRLAEEKLLAAQLGLGRQRRIELAVDAELRCGREVEDLLNFGHEMHLAAALEDVDALLGRDHGIAVEVGCALLELREVLDRLERALRAEEALDVHAAQGDRVDAVAELLRADVADQVKGRVRVTVGVAIEARDATAWTIRAAIPGVVEPLC